VDVLDRLKALFIKPPAPPQRQTQDKRRKPQTREDSVLDRALANTIRSLDQPSSR